MSIVAVGSCFAGEIGKKLSDGRFNILVNPFGTIFNPHSIAGLISAEDLNPDLFVKRDQNWCHFQLHSDLNHSDQEELKNHISEQKKLIQEKLETGDLLIITFGSAWIYRHIATNEIVANCHKFPQQNFIKELINPEDLKSQYVALFENLHRKNPKLKILLTVSPVKYLKDGLHENNLSKSVLLLLSDFLAKRFDFVYYFPAFELVNDDLRDYRFYKEDLAHPNEQAIKYIFEKFTGAYCSDKTKEIISLSADIRKLKSHRSITGADEIHKEKIGQLEKNLEDLLKTNG
ncbi:MAG: GSCFA domain-containing protein [Crocinitomicaceae bacterium]|nr:GSCFA domain-containing protein [Crocinitomicaceae bacterium]